MFPVLDSNLYPMRQSIWAFLELTVLSNLYFYGKRAENAGKKENDWNSASQVAKTLTEEDKELSDNISTTFVSFCGKSSKKLIAICVISAVMTVLRAEAVYYALMIPIILLFIFRMGNNNRP